MFLIDISSRSKTLFDMYGGNYMKVAYVRVSALHQNEDRQLDALKEYGIERYFIEKISAKDNDRPKLAEMLDFIREGDTVYIHTLDRLARSISGLYDLLDQLNHKGVTLKSHKENIDTSTATGRMYLGFLALINNFERDNLLERQAEGIAIAKEKGKYKGRQKIVIEDIAEWYNLYMNHKKNKSQIARELGVSYNTLVRLFDDYRKSIK